MSSGTGSGILDDVVNGATQLTTFGLAGYGSGGLKTGVTGTPAVAGLKDITGATAAEEANAQARDQFNQNTAAAATDRSNAQLQDQRNQIASSQSAAAAVATSSANPNNNTSGGKRITGDVSDFLGL